MTTEAVELQQETGYHLVASDQAQLQVAHEQMIQWAKCMQASCDAEVAEESANLEIAQSRKWATAPFGKRIRLAQKRRVFYEKIEIALHAGYVIVPSFAMTVFAVRTDVEKPRGGVKPARWGNQFMQPARMLPAGEGEYQNPAPAIMQQRLTEPDGKGGEKTVVTEWPTEFNDIEFPIALAKPALMSRTAEAISLKLFDEIGVAVDHSQAPRGDPIILGRLRNPRPSGSNLTFFIGWYFDPSRL